MALEPSARAVSGTTQAQTTPPDRDPNLPASGEAVRVARLPAAAPQSEKRHRVRQRTHGRSWHSPRVITAWKRAKCSVMV